MRGLLGRTGKGLLTGVATLSIAVTLFYVSLPTETRKQREAIEDPVGLLFAGLMLIYAISLWLVGYRRWQALAVFVLLWLLFYVVNIILNVTM